MVSNIPVDTGCPRVNARLTCGNTREYGLSVGNLGVYPRILRTRGSITHGNRISVGKSNIPTEYPRAPLTRPAGTGNSSTRTVAGAGSLFPGAKSVGMTRR